MATLSSYPLDRNKGSRGKIILRFHEDETRALIEAKGEAFVRSQRFILRGTVKPFKAELRPDKNGNKLINHGAGRLQLGVRVEDLTPLDHGSDLTVERLKIRVEADGVWLMQTTDTNFRQTRKHKTKGPKAKAPFSPVTAAAALPRPSAAPEIAEPAVAAPEEHSDLLVLRERVEEVENRLLSLEESLQEPEPEQPAKAQKVRDLGNDIVTLKGLFNDVLREHNATLIAITIDDAGQIDMVHVRPSDVKI